MSNNDNDPTELEVLDIPEHLLLPIQSLVHPVCMFRGVFTQASEGKSTQLLTF